MSLSSKTLNARVIQKHDTAENWAQEEAVSFIPKKGEIIIYDADSNNTPSRMKIGNGTSTVENLPFYTGITMEVEGTDSIPSVDMPSGGAVMDVQIDGISIVGEDRVAEIPKDYERRKYFNFIEAGVDVEGNPTYDEIKEAILNDVTPVLIHEHYIASMTSGHWDAEAFEREELPGFIFVTHRSDTNNHWKIKYTEFRCTKLDNGSTLWVASEHYYIEDFVAKYGVTTFSEIQNAYNKEKIMFCTHGGFVTKLDILAPNSYAQFSGLDDMGNPALLKVSKDNVWSRTNVTKATTDYVNSEINRVNTTIANQKTFVAEYNVTTFSEIQNSYNSGKAIICKDGWLIAKLDILRPDTYAQFSGLDDEGNPALLKVYKNNSWIRKNAMKASADFVSRINSNVSSLENSVDSIAQYINGKGTLLSALSEMNTVDILKSVYNFRGGFCDNAGTLHIKNPGIYLVIAGGRDNKTITINYPTGKEFEATKWSGIILLAYESGVVTPIGIKSSPLFADAFQLPGTFQGWTSDRRYSTTINYPGGCVVAYLGNSNVDYLA